MNFSELQSSGRFQSPTGEKVSTGKTALEKPVEKLVESTTPPPLYKAGEFDAQLQEPIELYKHAQAYAKQYSVQVAFNLETALQRRAKGDFCMTIRELDIAARLKLKINRDFFVKAIHALDGMLSEGIPGEPDNPYHLRAFYNRGIQFKVKKFGKSEYDRSAPAKQQKADAIMQEILAKLQQHNLPAWPEEIEQGFPVELCKPEYMTIEHYELAAKATVERYGAGDKAAVRDTFPITGTVLDIMVNESIDPSESESQLETGT